MTKLEHERRAQQDRALIDLGFTQDEADQLRRISLTLHRWAEHECNGTIQREGDDGTGRPRWYNPNTGTLGGYVPDRERGALKRLTRIVARCSVRRGWKANEIDYRRGLSFYVQGDPRGCALYILRHGDVPEGADRSSYYTRGIAVY